MLLGEYKHSIDTKGRLIIPAKFRESLGETFIVTRGLDGCLSGYPLKEWEKLAEKLQKLPMAKRETRKFTRFFYSAATECKIDKQGRVNLPKNLIEFAELEKTCYLIGVSDRIEIWSKENWDLFAGEAEGSFEDIAEEMIDFGF
ncbi:MAG: division/cell wall cluster transcriptional repressor MraZ [Atopostipes suicloacalis]|nr:division/cell wall cluster transcriptional repressor MraZ [Atopostipes suicloacalis]